MPKRPQRRSPRLAKNARNAKRQAQAHDANTIAGLPSLIALIEEILALLRGAAGSAPPKPLPPGSVGTEIPINPLVLQSLITAAATQDNGGQQVWTHNGNELLVLSGKVSVRLDDGFLLVLIPVACDQVGDAIIQVPFALGGKESPAGLVMATEKRPRGPDAIVDLWSEPLIAYAWRLVMTIAMKVAGLSGTDLDGSGLIPISLTASKDGLAVLPIARHTFDRVQS
jgi:hypothetical protein